MDMTTEQHQALRAGSWGERGSGLLAGLVLFACICFHAWGVSVGWESKNLPGGEFRQAQTALSAYWIDREQDFSLAYPTPVLGHPWSLPMEFPLYQWTVVMVHEWSGWSLTKAARAVSIACFYLCLPAVFLLLRRWNVAVRERGWVLALIVTCPFYIFYGRAFLIETMALMFSLWFWVAFERAVAGRNRGWLLIAVLAGCGAGLVKVTTFLLYLLPVAGWAVHRLWQQRRANWRAEFLWMMTALALPFALTCGWLHFADETKGLNPQAVFLQSAHLHDFNWGTNETRFSAALWAKKARIVGEELTWWPGLVLCGVIGCVVGAGRRRAMLACAAGFAAVLIIFPALYAYHSYYYVANAMLLLLAMGLAVVALRESATPPWLQSLLIALILGGQVMSYLRGYYPEQKVIGPGGDGLADSLRTVTNPEDVIVVLGQDWNSMLPYYTGRRALMLRDELGRDPVQMQQALADLGKMKIGALVIDGNPDGRRWLVDATEALGLSPQPLYTWREAQVYLPQARRAELLATILAMPFDGVRLAPEVAVPRAALAGRMIEVAALRTDEQAVFAGMNPRPVSVFSRFGPAVEWLDGHYFYDAHPTTRLIFSLPAGAHVLRATLRMKPEAYASTDVAESQLTDGVEVSLWTAEQGGARRLLATRLFNPRINVSERGDACPLVFEFQLPAAGRVELFFGPGPAVRDTRDWIQLGALTIE